MHLLPPNLAALAKLAAKESNRYSTTGVHLRLSGDGTYRAMATDSRIGAIVTGTGDPADEYPTPPGVPAGDGTDEGQVPARAFAEAFRPVKARRFKPILSNLAVVLEKNTATLASTDLEKATVAPVRLLEGRFPPMPDVVPTGVPRAAATVDPLLFARLLTAAAEFSDADEPRVDVEFRGQTNILVVRASRPNQTFVGIIQPLTKDRVEDEKPMDAGPTAAELKEQLESLAALAHEAWKASMGSESERVQDVGNRLFNAAAAADRLLAGHRATE
jgi:hypothetical protein